MYEALTAAYSLVYRGFPSPYSPDWCIEGLFDAFGSCKHLPQLFLKVIQMDRQFCEFSALNQRCSPNDD